MIQNSNGFRLLSRQLRCRTPVYRTFSSASRTLQQNPFEKQNINNNDSNKFVDFGFENVAEGLKQSRVASVFSSVASSYDTMNDLMSLGIHRLWKDHFVRALDPGLRPISTTNAEGKNKGWKILDVAGGTGDIAFRMLDHAATVHNDRSTTVTVADINASMLEEGRKRTFDTAYYRSPRLTFVEANAEDLHMIESSSLDLYTVAFGIRNFTDKPKALREAFRVLKPGGVFACLEFSKVQNAAFNEIYKRWSFGAIPLIGQLVAGDRDSYQYLVESIEKFPTQEEFAQMIRDAGFTTPSSGAYENLSGGIAAIHKGVKLE